MVTLKWSLVFDKMSSLLHGCAVTMEISILTLIFGTVLGVVLALMRDSRVKIVARIAQLYIWIWRGTPLMIQAFLIYFGLPNLGVTFSAMTAGVLSMSLNTGAYIAEIVRSGIMSIDQGQFEAGRSLGFNYVQTMRLIILPQAFKNVLPALANEFITLLKETSISGYIAIPDLTKGGDIIRSQTYDAFLPLFGVAVIYLVLVMILTAGVHKLETRLRTNER